MPLRKSYPDEIELKYPDKQVERGEPGLDNQARYEAAQVIKKYWDGYEDVKFKDFPELGVEEGYQKYTPSHYSNVFNDYFGPKDDYDITFGELYEEFESIEEYERHKRLEQEKQQEVQKAIQEARGGAKFTERDIELFLEGMRFMRDLMRNDEEIPSLFNQTSDSDSNPDRNQTQSTN